MRLIGLAAVAIIAIALLGVALASTASNTVPESKAGEGQGTITGYDISTVHYDLNDIDPSKIDAVTFTLDSAPPATSTIRVQVGSETSTWYTCTTVGTSATCPTTSPPAMVGLTSQLKVVAAQ